MRGTYCQLQSPAQHIVLAGTRMPVDDHRVEGLVNGFIAGKQDALFDAPDAYGEGNNRTSEQAVLNRMLAKEAFAGSTAQITSELSPTTENGKWRDR